MWIDCSLSRRLYACLVTKAQNWQGHIEWGFQVLLSVICATFKICSSCNSRRLRQVPNCHEGENRTESKSVKTRRDNHVQSQSRSRLAWSVQHRRCPGEVDAGFVSVEWGRRLLGANSLSHLHISRRYQLPERLVICIRLIRLLWPDEL